MAKKPHTGPSGFAIIDKEPGWTSHDVVAKCRGIFETRKVGHAGTLDPDATGVLLLGVGKGTRIMRFMQVLPKTYTCEVVFGTETHTLDDSGNITARHEMTLAPESVVAATAQFVGDIEQIPPMVSAVKIDGRRLHELAREGKEVERRPRPVTVYRYDVAPTDDPLVYTAVVQCSTGTYVRTLAADLGTALGGGAHLRNLRRTAIGSFTPDQGHVVEEAELLPLSEALKDLDAVTVDDETRTAISFGKMLSREQLGVDGDGPWAIYDVAGDLIAVYEPKGSQTKPAVMLIEL